jgi:hypothetical protein
MVDLFVIDDPKGAADEGGEDKGEVAPCAPWVVDLGEGREGAVGEAGE